MLGILLGTFTQIEAEACQPTIDMLVKKFAGKHLPIAVTHKIGHGTDAKAIVIGAHLRLEKIMNAAGAVAISFDYTRYSMNRNIVLDYLVYI